MIEVPDPVHDDASESEEVQEEEVVAEDPPQDKPLEEQPPEAEQPPEEGAQQAEKKPPAAKGKPRQSLKDRVTCEACGKEISRYCLTYSHKCKKKKPVPEPPPPPPEPPPLVRTAPAVKQRPAERRERVRFDKPVSKRVIQTANYWREMAAQDEPGSPEWNTADHLRQLHLYNRELANRRAAEPYERLFRRQIRV